MKMQFQLAKNGNSRKLKTLLFGLVTLSLTLVMACCDSDHNPVNEEAREPRVGTETGVDETAAKVAATDKGVGLDTKDSDKVSSVGQIGNDSIAIRIVDTIIPVVNHPKPVTDDHKSLFWLAQEKGLVARRQLHPEGKFVYEALLNVRAVANDQGVLELERLHGVSPDLAELALRVALKSATKQFTTWEGDWKHLTAKERIAFVNRALLLREDRGLSATIPWDVRVVVLDRSNGKALPDVEVHFEWSGIKQRVNWREVKRSKGEKSASTDSDGQLQLRTGKADYEIEVHCWPEGYFTKRTAITKEDIVDIEFPKDVVQDAKSIHDIAEHLDKGVYITRTKHIELVPQPDAPTVVKQLQKDGVFRTSSGQNMIRLSVNDGVLKEYTSIGDGLIRLRLPLKDEKIDFQIHQVHGRHVFLPREIAIEVEGAEIGMLEKRVPNQNDWTEMILGRYRQNLIVSPENGFVKKLDLDVPASGRLFLFVKQGDVYSRVSISLGVADSRREELVRVNLWQEVAKKGSNIIYSGDE